ncbi:helix-turn-helix protein [Chryseobacterium sp. 7]|uniref:helix-turn-helix domain-containing protein n=1 Tax=Chryseobacterium sp. 7 TaxID=2035214 RepID=UPI000EB1DA30|nr:AraC family transcriptional regulator [Chryseobacterium sp. 7]RLJ33277.1 helix-turn-helix protein [Chryseobacterium sp. 7]
MDNIKLREQEALRLKKELVTRYNYLMAIILLIYTLIFFFIINDKLVGYYCLVGTFFLVVLMYIFKDTTFPSISLEKKVQTYLIFAPLYVFFLIFYFWKYTIVNFCWLVPIPFGAYIFLGKRKGFIYSIYSLSIFIVLLFITTFFSFNSIEISYTKIRYTDILVVSFNIIISCLFVYYKDKMKEQELLSTIEKREQITLPITLDEEDISDAKSLFEKIENEMITQRYFINPKFNISLLNTILKSNNNYISRAIRLQGYPNFNTYVNSHRINYVKELIEKNDLEKITLMYIYSEAGFINQSTFNRAFKQIVGMTPSEYIREVKK